MNPRVVVLAEGANEAPGGGYEVNPTEWLDPDTHHGAAHVLVGRCLERATGIKRAALHFEQPLRVRGRKARGSDLLRPERLLTWPPGKPAPTLAVLFVDEDGDPSRLDGLVARLQRIRTPVALGVAVREFEAWLVADASAIRQRLGRSGPRHPEGAAPREVKRWLDQQIGNPSHQAEVRRDLAEGLDLDVVAKVCPSFDRFRRELADTWQRSGPPTGSP